MTPTRSSDSRPKTTIILPGIKKLNPQEYRKDPKHLRNQFKNSNIKNNNIRRAGPRGG
jgi:hypothetical protein